MKINRSSVLAASAVLILASSGSSSSGEASDVDQTDPTEAAEASNSSMPTEEADGDEPSAQTLTVWTDEPETAEAVVEQASADLGIEFDIVSIPYTELQSQYEQAVAVGEGPDLLFTSCGLHSQLAPQNLVAEIQAGDAIDQLDDAAIAASSWDGSLYCAPISAQSIAQVRNTALVPERPADWNEVQELCAEWPDDGTYCAGFVSADDFDAFHVFPIITAYGGYLFGYDGVEWDTSDVGINDPGTREAFSMIGDLVNSGKAITGTPDELLSLYQDGDIGLWITGDWNTNRLDDSTLEYTIEPAPDGPAGPGRPFVNSFGVYVNPTSPQLALAQLFVRDWTLTDDGMAAWQDAWNSPSSWLPLQSTSDQYAGFEAAAKGGEPIPQINVMAEAWAPWGNALNQSFNNGSSVVDDATQDAHDAVVAAVG